MIPPVQRQSSVTSHIVDPRAPFLIASMRASVWVMDQLVGKKNTSLLAHAPTTPLGTCRPWAPVVGKVTIVGMPPTAYAAAASDSANLILLVSQAMTTFSPGFTAAHWVIAFIAPRIISIKLDEDGT